MPFGLEIIPIVILKSKELDFKRANTIRMSTEGLPVDFNKNDNLSHYA